MPKSWFSYNEDTVGHKKEPTYFCR